MKKIIERTFASIYFGYKNSENENMPIIRAIGFMVLLETSLILLLISRMNNLRYFLNSKLFHISTPLIILGIVCILFAYNLIYFKAERVEEIEKDFISLSPLKRNIFSFVAFITLIASIVLIIVL